MRCFIRTCWALSPSRAKDAPTWIWNDVGTEVQEYVPHDFWVPVEAWVTWWAPTIPTSSVVHCHSLEERTDSPSTRKQFDLVFSHRMFFC